MFRVTFFAILAACFLLAATGCGEAESTSPTSSSGSDERPGSPAVYARIAALTDCQALQREFDVAMDNADRQHDAGGTADASLAYSEAADERMREVGCYG